MTDVSKNMDALQERIQQSIVDKIIDVPIPQVRDNLVLMEFDVIFANITKSQVAVEWLIEHCKFVRTLSFTSTNLVVKVGGQFQETPETSDTAELTMVNNHVSQIRRTTFLEQLPLRMVAVTIHKLAAVAVAKRCTLLVRK